MTTVEKLAKVKNEITKIRFETYDTNEAAAFLTLIEKMIESYDPDEYLIDAKELEKKVKKVLVEFNEAQTYC